MTVSDLNWFESMNAVRGARVQACPNPFFQEQLELYEKTNLQQVLISYFNLPKSKLKIFTNSTY